MTYLNTGTGKTSKSASAARTTASGTAASDDVHSRKVQAQDARVPQEPQGALGPLSDLGQPQTTSQENPPVFRNQPAAGPVSLLGTDGEPTAHAAAFAARLLDHRLPNGQRIPLSPTLAQARALAHLSEKALLRWAARFLQADITLVREDADGQRQVLHEGAPEGQATTRLRLHVRQGRYSVVRFIPENNQRGYVAELQPAVDDGADALYRALLQAVRSNPKADPRLLDLPEQEAIERMRQGAIDAAQQTPADFADQLTVGDVHALVPFFRLVQQDGEVVHELAAPAPDSRESRRAAQHNPTRADLGQNIGTDVSDAVLLGKTGGHALTEAAMGAVRSAGKHVRDVAADIARGPMPKFMDLEKPTAHPPLTDDRATRAWLEKTFVSAATSGPQQGQVVNDTTIDFKNLLQNMNDTWVALHKALPPGVAADHILAALNDFPRHIAAQVKDWHDDHSRLLSADRNTARRHVDDQTLGFMVADFYRSLEAMACLGGRKSSGAGRQVFEALQGYFKELKRNHVTSAATAGYLANARYKAAYVLDRQDGHEMSIGDSLSRRKVINIELGLGAYVTEALKLDATLLSLNIGKTAKTYSPDDLNTAANNKLLFAAELGAMLHGNLGPIKGQAGGSATLQFDIGAQLKASNMAIAQQLATLDKYYDGNMIFKSASRRSRKAAETVTNARNYVTNLATGNLAKGNPHSVGYANAMKLMVGRNNADRALLYARQLDEASGGLAPKLGEALHQHYPSVGDAFEALLQKAAARRQDDIDTLAAKTSRTPEEEQKLLLLQQPGAVLDMDYILPADMELLRTAPVHRTPYAALVKNKITAGLNQKMKGQYRRVQFGLNLEAALGSGHVAPRSGDDAGPWKPEFETGLVPFGLRFTSYANWSKEFTLSERFKSDIHSVGYLGNGEGPANLRATVLAYQTVYRAQVGPRFPDAIHPCFHLSEGRLDTARSLAHAHRLAMPTEEQFADADPDGFYGIAAGLDPNFAKVVHGLHQGTLDASRCMQAVAADAARAFDTLAGCSADMNRLMALRGKPGCDEAAQAFNKRYLGNAWNLKSQSKEDIGFMVAKGYAAVEFAFQKLIALCELVERQGARQVASKSVEVQKRFASDVVRACRRLQTFGDTRNEAIFPFDRETAFRQLLDCAVGGNVKSVTNAGGVLELQFLSASDLTALDGLALSCDLHYTDLKQGRHVNKTRQGRHPGVMGTIKAGTSVATVIQQIHSLLQKHDLSPWLRTALRSWADHLATLPATMATKRSGMGFEVRWQVPAGVEDAVRLLQFVRFFVTEDTGISGTIPVSLTPPPVTLTIGGQFGESSVRTTKVEFGPDSDFNLLVYNAKVAPMLVDKKGVPLSFEQIEKNLLDPANAMFADGLFSAFHPIVGMLETFRRDVVGEDGPHGSFERVLYGAQDAKVREQATHATHFAYQAGNKPLDAPPIQDQWAALKIEAVRWRPVPGEVIAWLDRCTMAQRRHYFLHHPNGKLMLQRYITVMQGFVKHNTASTTASHLIEAPGRRHIASMPVLAPDGSNPKTVLDEVGQSVAGWLLGLVPSRTEKRKRMPQPTKAWLAAPPQPLANTETPGETPFPGTGNWLTGLLRRLRTGNTPAADNAAATATGAPRLPGAFDHRKPPEFDPWLHRNVTDVSPDARWFELAPTQQVEPVDPLTPEEEIPRTTLLPLRNIPAQPPGSRT